MSPEVLTLIGQVGLGAIFLWLFIRQSDTTQKMVEHERDNCEQLVNLLISNLLDQGIDVSQVQAVQNLKEQQRDGKK